MRKENKYPLALPKGTILNGQYVLNRVLGQGGFGITYEAQDYHTKQTVAVKEYFPESAATRSGGCAVLAYSEQRAKDFLYGKRCFLKEAETLAALNGTPGIVRVYTYFEENGTAYFSMEFVRGMSFQQYIIEHGGAIRWDAAIRILAPVMRALSKIHTKGIIHRDIKPENIFLADDGNVKLLDFGSARYSMGEKGSSLDVLLTHGFAPWEQYSRHSRQGAYTDVYGLAATFYYAVTGRIPPDAVDRMDKDELIPFHRLGMDVPMQVDSALWKALAVRPESRFQNMNSFQRALGEYPVEEEDEDDTIYNNLKWSLPILSAIVAICVTAAVFVGFHMAGDQGSGASKKVDDTPTLCTAESESQESEQQAQPQEDPSEAEGIQNAPTNNADDYQYTIVDGRDSGIIMYKVDDS